MQFTVPTGDVRRTEELVKLIKRHASGYELQGSTKDGDTYELTFEKEEDGEKFRAETAELLKMI